MNKIEHTPGPWIRHPYDKVYIHKTANQPDYVGRQIAVASHFAGVKREEAEANAQLIAAAPDLLRACKNAQQALIERDEDLMMGAMCMCTAAITKVEIRGNRIRGV